MFEDNLPYFCDMKSRTRHIISLKQQIQKKKNQKTTENPSESLDCTHPHSASQGAEDADAGSLGKHKQQTSPPQDPEFKFCQVQGRHFRDSAFSNLLPR